MLKLNDKLSSFSMAEVEKLIEAHKDVKFPLKSSSVKKMYTNWLRNDNLDLTFPEVFEKKLNEHNRKMCRSEEEFSSIQVGWIEIDYDEPSYMVHLHGEQPYKVSWLEGTENPLAKMEESMLKFCKTNSVKLNKSGQRNIKVIQTVFSA